MHSHLDYAPTPPSLPTKTFLFVLDWTHTHTIAYACTYTLCIHSKHVRPTCPCPHTRIHTHTTPSFKNTYLRKPLHRTEIASAFDTSCTARHSYTQTNTRKYKPTNPHTHAHTHEHQHHTHTNADPHTDRRTHVDKCNQFLF